MITSEEKQEIINIVKEFVRKIEPKIEVQIEKVEDNTILVNLKSEDPQNLIGPKGQVLFSIQHLLRKVIRQKLEKEFYIDIDVNSYKKRRIEYLKELAKSTADEVSLSKKPKELEPMPAHERRIIHLEIAARPDVISESIGEKDSRRVVIKPYP